MFIQFSEIQTCEAVPIPLYGGIYLHTTLSNIVSWLFHDQMLCFKADNMYTDAYLKVLIGHFGDSTHIVLK